MRALVVADGDVPDRARLDAAWPGWSDDVGLVVAADGGALGARRLDLAIDLVVGDMDSLDETALADLRALGVEVETVPAAKDESDTELALIAAATRGATSITVVGAFGGPRLDHELANIGLLALARLDACAVELLDERARVSAIHAPDAAGRPVTRRLGGRPGDLVSLIVPAGVAEGVSADGLRYPLLDEPLVAGPARGLSNVRLAAEATVTVRRGLLLVVESPARPSPTGPAPTGATPARLPS
jgi:thiamine pyrophosphokinase